MKTVAIIVEYNPFHNGHKYQIEETKKRTSADHIVVIMSGNFVQRGTPAMIDKYARTSMALNHGVDVVIELPTIYATASAEFFASGAIHILNGLKIIDELVFGSECGDLEYLDIIADIFIKEPPSFIQSLKNYVKLGQTYPVARKHALLDYLKEQNLDSFDLTLMKEILDQPNNILGIEYLKALKRCNSTIKPVTIKRHGASYHSKNYLAPFSSATSLRHFFENCYSLKPQLQSEAPLHLDHSSFDQTQEHIEQIKLQLPTTSVEILMNQYNVTFPIRANDFSTLLYYQLSKETKHSLTEYADITTDLANRIYDLFHSGFDYSSFAEGLKSKQYTLTRINRCLIHIVLGIKSNFINTYGNSNDSFYARILGFQKHATPLFRLIKEREGIPVIVKTANAKKLLSPIAYEVFSVDINSAHLYNQIVFERYKTLIPGEFIHGPIIKHV